MTLHFADLHVAVRFSQLPPTVPRRIVSVEKNLQSQTCLFERYYAAFCRPAIANMSLRTILRYILQTCNRKHVSSNDITLHFVLPCTWRFVSTLQLLPTVPRRLCQSRRRKILFPLSINQTTDHTHGNARIRVALWPERVGRPLSVESGRRDTATTRGHIHAHCAGITSTGW